MGHDDKMSELVKTTFTILGGALLLYPLIDEAAKTIVPEMQKLTSGEMMEELKALPIGQEKQEEQQEKKQENTQDDQQEQDHKESEYPFTHC